MHFWEVHQNGKSSLIFAQCGVVGGGCGEGSPTHIILIFEYLTKEFIQVLKSERPLIVSFKFFLKDHIIREKYIVREKYIALLNGAVVFDHGIPALVT